ncbi:hypothetical protein [Cohnella sp. GCM10027633]|uniref:hypothetical protein n=1 Tax=unclassified Cohnella TaxID=2636738 RepID=UPI003629EF05
MLLHDYAAYKIWESNQRELTIELERSAGGTRRAKRPNVRALLSALAGLFR